MTMSAWMLANEAQVRLGAFLLVFGGLIVAQRLWPRRDVPGGWRRSATNIALVVIDTAILRVAFPLLAFDLSLRVEESGTGLLHGLPPALAVVAGILLLDVAIYWQHRLLHMIPFLWRLHRVHHADTGFDVTTGVRFHPLEIVLSMGIKLGLIALLGVPPIAVLIFELALSLGSLFTHANLYLPATLDRRLRWLFVTPEMHRIHHSWHRDETDSNYGFHLSIWDRLFRSYRTQPRDGHEAMTIGLHEFRDNRSQSLASLLLNPFRRNKPAVSG
ncbi:MAG: sterol desaturase family protein [Woeseiaceae bacterium]|nr:sterol desaturase family protein [Woeseiaceae bacterium]